MEESIVWKSRLRCSKNLYQTKKGWRVDMIRRSGRRELRQADKRGSCLLYICYSPVGFCRILWPLCDDTAADFDTHPRLYGNEQLHCDANGTMVVWDDVSGRWRCFVDFFPSKRLPGDPSPPIVLYCKIFRTPSSCFSRRNSIPKLQIWPYYRGVPDTLTQKTLLAPISNRPPSIPRSGVTH